MRSGRILPLLLATTLVCGWAAAFAQSACSSHLTPAEIDARIDALIAKMTLAEKVAQLQDRAPAIPRLQIPAYNWWNEGLHGIARNGYATVFPQAIGLAATWDPQLLHEVGDVVSTEARAKFNTRVGQDSARYGGLTIWSPNINIFRDPRWGRGQETYGEDPFLTSKLGMQFVSGVQGEDRFYLKADATPKHFAAHSGPERGRDSFNAVVSQHDLDDTYFRAFHALTAEGHAAAIMCSYNEINGVPSCGSKQNLDEMLRGRWGFRGYVVSDCDAVGDISAYHHYAPDAEHAAADALKAGVDLDCGDTFASLNKAVQDHLTTEAEVNRALHRLLLARVHLGMFDPASCSPYGRIGASEIDSAAHHALAERAAEESMVLLKNDGVLPLGKGKRVAVVGATADMLKILEANYHGTASHPITPIEGLSSEMHVVSYSQGALLADGLPAIVPRSAWRVSTSPDAAAGIRAEFFNSPDLSGAPVTREVVAKIDQDIDRVAFVPAQTNNQYSALWSGAIVPPAPGDYVLRVDVERCWDCKTHDAFRLFVDGRMVLDNHGAKGETDRTTVHFADTRAHAIRLEYMHTGDDEGVGLEWIPPSDALLQQAVNAARSADVIVAFAGLSPDLEGEALQVELPGFDGGDRTRLELPQTQRTLLEHLRTLGKPMVLVLTSGSAVALGPDAQAADAIIEAWYPGEAGGTALAKLVSGEANFSGRLPVTFYRSVTELPAFTDYSMAHRTYRYFDGPVQYPFGFGLSYSRFRYGAIRLSSATPNGSNPLTVKVQVRNASRISGSEVAELYVRPPQVPGAPRLALQGEQRVYLKAGESRELTFSLTPEQWSIVSPAGERLIVPGAYQIFVGGSQPDSAHTPGATFHVASEKQIPQKP